MDRLGHYSRYSAGLSYERIRRKVFLEKGAIHRPDADSHGLVGVWRIAFHDKLMIDAACREARGKRAQFAFIGDVQRDGISAVRQSGGS